MRKQYILIFFSTLFVINLQALAEEITVKVMTYNTCRGGTCQGQPLSQSARMIEEAQADIVGEDLEHADIVVSPYPSDHRAVVATFTLPDQPRSEKL